MAIPIVDPNFRRSKKTQEKRDGYIRYCQEHFTVDNPDTKEKIGPARRDFIISRNTVSGIIHCPSRERVLMLRQFRMPVMHDTDDLGQAWIYETVAGIIEDGHTPEDTFVRETLEEAGVTLDPRKVEKVAEFYPSPGISTEKMFVFTCEVDECLPSKPGGGLEEEAEAIVARWLTFDQIHRLKAQNRFQDGKTLIGLMSLGF